MVVTDVIEEARDLVNEMPDNPEYVRALVHLVARLIDNSDVDDTRSIARLLVLPEERQ